MANRSSRFKEMEKIKSQTKYFDGLQIEPLESFSGENLPTNLEILRRYFTIRQSSCKTKQTRIIAKEIYSELSEIYAKGPFLMKKEQNCLNYICKLPVRFDKESKNEKKLSKETKENEFSIH